jgi:hypothetical protein
VQAHQLQPEIDQSHQQLTGEKYDIFLLTSPPPPGINRVKDIQLETADYADSGHSNFNQR